MLSVFAMFSSSVQRTGSIQSTLPWMALYRSSSSTQAPTNPAFMHFQSVVRQASASGRPAAVPPLALASGGTPSIPVSKVPPPPVSSAAAPTQQTRWLPYLMLAKAESFFSLFRFFFQRGFILCSLHFLHASFVE